MSRNRYLSRPDYHREVRLRPNGMAEADWYDVTITLDLDKLFTSKTARRAAGNKGGRSVLAHGGVTIIARPSVRP